MNDLNELPCSEGDVAYFHHLHLDKVERLERVVDGRNLKVSGKPRRMLVLHKRWWLDWCSIQATDKGTGTNECTWYNVKGRPGYLVVSLVSQCPSGLERIHSKPLRDLIDDGKPSVICFIPTFYPAECYAQCGPKRKRVSREVTNHVWRELNERGLGRQVLDPQTMG